MHLTHPVYSNLTKMLVSRITLPLRRWSWGGGAGGHEVYLIFFKFYHCPWSMYFMTIDAVTKLCVMMEWVETSCICITFRHWSVELKLKDQFISRSLKRSRSRIKNLDETKKVNYKIKDCVPYIEHYLYKQ